MKDRLPCGLALLAAAVVTVASPVFGQAQARERATGKSPAKAKAEAGASTASPGVQVAIESILDRRTTRDFPKSALTVELKLGGEDASAVRSARPRVIRAVDDTGRNVVDAGVAVMRGPDGWQQARDDGPPALRFDLGSPSRKAKTLTVMEGVVETYLPSKDPAATVKVDRVTSKKDKPLAVPALAREHVKIRILSKAGLESEKKQAEAKKKADAARKGEGKEKKDEVEEMAGAMANAMVETLERLFLTAGENDLIVKVDDPGKKIFSFDVTSADGKPIPSYGTMDLEGYRIVRMLEPIPESGALLVRLKTARTFGEVTFAFKDVKLP